MGPNRYAQHMKIVYQGKIKTGEEIIIRYPEIDDVEKLLKYINELSDEKTFIRYQGEHESLESEKKWLEGCFDKIKNKKAVRLVAFYNNEVVGSTDIELLDKTEKHIGIFGITVRKDFRSKGLGNMLMKLILKEAKNEIPNIKIITLEVFSPNKIAKNLYEKFGFIEYGMLPKGVSRGEKFDDTILMYRNI